MRLRPLDCFGLDVPVPLATAEPEPEGALVALSLELPVATHPAYLAALDAWARVSRFRSVSRRDAGSVHLRRYERGEARVVLHLGVEETIGVLAIAAAAPHARFDVRSWDATLEASTDREVAMLEATVDFGAHAATAGRAIEHRLGLPVSALDAFDPSVEQSATPADIVDGTLRDKSRLQLPAGSNEALVVEVDGARHYTIRSTAKLSAASLRKHYRAWAKAQGYDVLGDLYDGEILELTLRRRTRGLVISWARGESHTTVQVGPGRQLLARQA